VAGKYVTEIRAAVGTGNIKFPSGCISIINSGDAYGNIFGDLYANGTRILYKSAPYNPGWGFSMPDVDKYWDMPSGGVTFTLKAGHDSTVDETVTLPVKPPAAGVVITGITVLASLMIFGSTLALIFLERKFKI
jgi:hypothetical protein